MQVRDRVGLLGALKQARRLRSMTADRLGQVLDLRSVAVLAHPLDDGVEHLTDLVDQARNRGVGADRVAVAAGGAVLGDPLRMLEADSGHVAEQRRRRPASRRAR